MRPILSHVPANRLQPRRRRRSRPGGERLGARRYKATAEQHYKEYRAAKAAQAASDEGGPGGGYRFDLELCRRTFDAYDRDGSGFLDITELTELSEARARALERRRMA